MANDIRINLELTGEQQTNRGLQRTADNLEDTGDAARKAGGGLDQMAKDAGFLDKRIGELRNGVRALTAQLNVTGDASLIKDIKAANREMAELSGLRKKLFEMPAGNAKKFGEDLTESLRALKGPAIGALVGVGAAAAPLLGGIIASAVLGGVGAGGIIGGLALAAQDQRVEEAGSKLGKHAMAAFTRSAAPLVEPALEAIGVLRGVVDDVSASMRQAFGTVAPVLVPLTKGISGLVQQMMPGLIDAMKGARPVLLTISSELPKIGASIGMFLSTIAEDPRGAIQAFRTLSGIIQGTILFVGELIAGLSKVWAVLGPITQGMSGDFAGMAANVLQAEAAMKQASEMSDGLSSGLEDVGGAAKTAADEITFLKQAMDVAFGKVMDIQRATIAYEKSWDDTIETLHEGKRTLDATTKAGQDNRGAILDNIQAITDMQQANINNGMSVAEANTIYDKQIERLREAAIKAGFNKQQVNELIEAFDRLPKDIELELRVKGLKGVIEQVKALAGLLGSKAAASASIDGSYVSGRASGGPVMAGQTYIVGENGPEVLQMGSSGGMVYNAQQSRAMMSGWGSSPQSGFTASSGAARDVVVLQSDGSAWSDAVMEGLRKALRDRGGNADTLIQLSSGSN